jgi:hypothetical protein
MLTEYQRIIIINRDCEVINKINSKITVETFLHTTFLTFVIAFRGKKLYNFVNFQLILFYFICMIWQKTPVIFPLLYVHVKYMKF